MENKNHPKEHAQGQRLAFGVVLIGLGSSILLRNLDMLPEVFCNMIFSWPMIVFAIGFVTFFGKNKFFGIILMAVGTAFLIPIFLDVDYSFRKIFIPVILVVIGLGLITKNWTNCFKPKIKTSSDPDYIDEVAVFGGGEKHIINPNFKGGKITAVFGGVELDLTRSEIADGECIIDLTCVFGGASLIIPQHWNVRTDVTPIFGGFSDKRLNRDRNVNTNKTLVIKGTAIFGGGEIKSA